MTPKAQIRVIKKVVVLETPKRRVQVDEFVLVQLRRQLLRSLDDVNKSLNISGCENCGRKV